MFSRLKTYTLNELLDICDSSNLKYEIFDQDEFNFYFEATCESIGIKYLFSGMTGNSLRYQRYINI